MNTEDSVFTVVGPAVMRDDGWGMGYGNGNSYGTENGGGWGADGDECYTGGRMGGGMGCGTGWANGDGHGCGYGNGDLWEMLLGAGGLR